MENSHLSDCESLYKEKKIEESLKCFDNYFRREKETVENFRKKGIFSINLKKYNNALSFVNNILKISPEDSNFLSRKGMILGILGNDEKALFFLDQALKFNSNDYLALLNKAIVMINLKNYNSAISNIDNILKFQPNDFTALNTKAFALEQLGKNDEAVSFYLKALDIKPENSNDLSKLIYHFIHFITEQYDLNDKNWEEKISEENLISNASKNFLKNQYKITELYQKYLSRNPDLYSMEYFLLKLLQGKTLEWVENEMKNSDEVKLLVSKKETKLKITKLYQKYLSRNPDLDGMEYFILKLSQGKTLEWVENEMKNSDEKKDKNIYFQLD